MLGIWALQTGPITHRPHGCPGPRVVCLMHPPPLPESAALPTSSGLRVLDAKFRSSFSLKVKAQDRQQDEVCCTGPEGPYSQAEAAIAGHGWSGKELQRMEPGLVAARDWRPISGVLGGRGKAS